MCDTFAFCVSVIARIADTTAIFTMLVGATGDIFALIYKYTLTIYFFVTAFADTCSIFAIFMCAAGDVLAGIRCDALTIDHFVTFIAEANAIFTMFVGSTSLIGTKINRTA